MCKLQTSLRLYYTNFTITRLKTLKYKLDLQVLCFRIEERLKQVESGMGIR